MRILITGASGSIGKKLTRLLSASGHELILLYRQKDDALAKFGRLVYGDLADKISLAAAASAAEAVIHIAGLTHTNNIKLYYQVNFEGTKNLLQASKQAGVKRFIFISSRTASPTGGGYAQSKFLAEEEVKKSGLDWLILRLSEVYGASDNEAIGRLIRLIKSSYLIPVVGRGQYKVSPIFIDDAVAGIAAALNHAESQGKIYNLAGPEEFTFNELISRILQEMKLKRLKIYIPVALIKIILAVFSGLKINFFVKDQLPRLLNANSADISQAVKDFNFQPRDFSNGLKKMLV